MSADMLVIRAMLALLAAYHLGIGVTSLLSPRTAGRVAAAFYGTDVAESPQLRYGLRMLGLYAIALGSLLTLAAWSPAEHREVIVVACGLQLARAACRVAFRRELAAGFNVSPSRNYLNVSLLVAEACVLAIAIPGFGG